MLPKALVSNLPEYHIEEDIVGIYFEELKNIQSPEELIVFVKRWAIVWMLYPRFSSIRRRTKIWNAKIVKMDFDSVEAFNCIESVGWDLQGSCSHIQDGVCAGMMIRMPPSLLEAYFFAQKYDVPTGVALHQVFCRNNSKHYGCF